MKIGPIAIQLVAWKEPNWLQKIQKEVYIACWKTNQYKPKNQTEFNEIVETTAKNILNIGK